MKEITMDCKGKINLSIDVVGERQNGYHDVEMVMLAVDVCDRVRLRLRTDGEIVLHTSDDKMPGGMENLACRAAKVFFDTAGKSAGVDIWIEKKIPMGAGMAGGSADAAGVLRGLNKLYDAPFTQEELMDMGAGLGADIPFCIFGGCALAEGIGERLTALPLPPPRHYVIAKPAVSVSTKWVYDRLDISKRPEGLSVPAAADAIRRGDMEGMIRSAGNILETVTLPAHPVVEEYKLRMQALGAELAMMSGSGSAVYGMFSDLQTAKTAAAAFRELTEEVYLV